MDNILSILEKPKRVAVSLLLTIIAFIIGSILFASLTSVISPGVSAQKFASTPLGIISSYLAVQIGGLGMVALLFAKLTDSLDDVLSLSLPEKLTVSAKFTLTVVVGLTLFNELVLVFANYIGFPVASHSTVKAIEANPVIGVITIVGSFLIVAPTEELLFRGVIQSYLAGVYDTAGAITATSVIFAVVHIGAYSGATPVELIIPLGTTFLVSIALGWLYSRFETLLVPIVCHGLFNTFSVIFSMFL